MSTSGEELTTEEVLLIGQIDTAYANEAYTLAIKPVGERPITDESTTDDPITEMVLAGMAHVPEPYVVCMSRILARTGMRPQ